MADRMGLDEAYELSYEAGARAMLEVVAEFAAKYKNMPSAGFAATLREILRAKWPEEKKA